MERCTHASQCREYATKDIFVKATRGVVSNRTNVHLLQVEEIEFPVITSSSPDTVAQDPFTSRPANTDLQGLPSLTEPILRTQKDSPMLPLTGNVLVIKQSDFEVAEALLITVTKDLRCLRENLEKRTP